MNETVLDASALLAVLNAEPGSETLSPEILSSATSSTVNLVEVQGKLVSLGMDPEEAWESALAPIHHSTPFTEGHAKIAGTLITQTRTLGLSLGDRACLALAIALQAPVYTTDRSWKSLRLGIRIHVLR